jgi:ABC-2 type transport system permease protein
MRWLEPGSLPWLVLHEMRLAFRSGPLTRRRKWLRLALLLVYAGFGVFVAYGLRHVPLEPAPKYLVYASSGLVLLFTFMLTQTLLSGQRTLFTAGDLDLLLSSPLPERRVLSAKLLGVAGSAAATFSIFLLPVALPVAIWGHPRLLALVPIIASLAVVAAAGGLGLAILLVRALGARGARSVGQIVAALVGGLIFLISQLSSNGMVRTSRFAVVSGWMRRTGWGVEGWSAWPARALFGEILPLLACAAVAALVFLGASTLLRTHFLRSWQSTGDRGGARRVRAKKGGPAFATSLTGAVVRKELRLLSREPEILFTLLMRLVYLAPLLILALKSTRDQAGLQVPALAAIGALAAGQLAGSLAWLTLSAEDAPDLLAVAPVERAAIRRSKLIAALLIATPFALLVPIVIGLKAPLPALAAFLGALAAGWGAGSVELRLGKPQKRSTFNRRREGSFLVSLLGVGVALIVGTVTAAAAYLLQEVGG